MTRLLSLPNIVGFKNACLANHLSPNTLLSKEAPTGLQQEFDQLFSTAIVIDDYPLDIFTLEQWKKKQPYSKLIDAYTKPVIRQFMLADYTMCVLLAFLFENSELVVGSEVFNSKVQSHCEDGLILDITPELEFRSTGITFDNYFIPYNIWLMRQPFRRWGRGSFLDELLLVRHLLGRQVSKFGVAVEHDVLIKKEFLVEMEVAAHSYGCPGISLELLNNDSFPENATGSVTRHERVYSDPEQFFMYDLSSLDIMWSKRDDEKILQMEELVPLNAKQHKENDFVQNAYLHSIWSDRRQAFIHFDAAVKTYSKEKYESRLYADMKGYNGKADSYKKLFRIDAPLDILTWGRLVGLFFQENELVHEYINSIAENYEVLKSSETNLDERLALGYLRILKFQQLREEHHRQFVESQIRLAKFRMRKRDRRN